MLYERAISQFGRWLFVVFIVRWCACWNFCYCDGFLFTFCSRIYWYICWLLVLLFGDIVILLLYSDSSTFVILGDVILPFYDWNWPVGGDTIIAGYLLFYIVAIVQLLFYHFCSVTLHYYIVLMIPLLLFINTFLLFIDYWWLFFGVVLVLYYIDCWWYWRFGVHHWLFVLFFCCVLIDFLMIHLNSDDYGVLFDGIPVFVFFISNVVVLFRLLLTVVLTIVDDVIGWSDDVGIHSFVRYSSVRWFDSMVLCHSEFLFYILLHCIVHCCLDATWCCLIFSEYRHHVRCGTLRWNTAFCSGIVALFCALYHRCSVLWWLPLRYSCWCWAVIVALIHSAIPFLFDYLGVHCCSCRLLFLVMPLSVCLFYICCCCCWNTICPCCYTIPILPGSPFGVTFILLSPVELPSVGSGDAVPVLLFILGAGGFIHCSVPDVHVRISGTASGVYTLAGTFHSVAWKGCSSAVLKLLFVLTWWAFVLFLLLMEVFIDLIGRCWYMYCILPVFYCCLLLL